MFKKMNAEFINDELGTVEITNPHTDKKCWVVFGNPVVEIAMAREFEILGVGDTQDAAIKDALVRCFDFRKEAAHMESVKEYVTGIFEEKNSEKVFLGCYPDNHEKDQVLPNYNSEEGESYNLKICQTDDEDSKDEYCLLLA